MKNPKVVMACVVFGAGVIALMVFSMMGSSSHRVEVCMEFRGRQACRIASGAERDKAQRTATGNACDQIASGMTDSIACEQSQPVSVRWLEGK